MPNREGTELVDDLTAARAHIVESEAAAGFFAGEGSTTLLSQDTLTLLKETPSFVLIVGRDHRVQFINHTQPYHTDDAVLGERLVEFLPEEARDAVTEALRQTIEGGSSSRQDIPGPGPTLGSTALFSTTISPVRQEGKIVGACLIGMDITEREQKGLELAALVEQRTGELEKEIDERRQAEEATRQSLERYRAIADTALDSIFCKDLESRYTFVNATMERVLGRPAAELLGKTPRQVFGAEAAAVVEAVDAPVFRGETSDAVRTLTLNGMERNLHTIQVPLRGADGEVTGICGIVRDVTDSKRIEAALRLQEKIVFCSSDMLALLGRDYTYLAANPAYLDSIGRELSEVVGHTPAEVFGQEFFEQDIEPRAKRCLAGESVHYQGWFDFPVAGRRYMDVSYEPHREDGETRGFIVAARDITEKRLAEEALVTSERRLTEAAAIARLGHWLLDPAAGSITGSEELFRIFGLDRGTRELAAFVNLVRAEDRERALDLVNQGMEHGESWDTELRIVAADGGSKTVHSKGEAVRNAVGEVEYLVGMVQDVSDRKRIEEETRALEARVQQTQKLESLGILAGGIAHDFNNMLCGILGNADLALLDTPAHARGRRYLGEIVKTAQQCAALANQMLAYSGKGGLVVTAVDLRSLVADMEDLLRSSVSKKIVLSLDLHDDLPLIEADASQLSQLILNLVINGADAIGDDQGHVSVTATGQHCGRACHCRDWTPGGDRMAEGPCIILEVSDTGCGMNAETKARVFEPFFTTKRIGRGLGLAAVYGIVRGHGGALDVDSELGKGTTFKAAIPALDERATVDTRAAEVADDWRGSGTVLLVDDDEIVRNVAAGMLERMGFSVVAVADGVAAIEAYERRRDDVVLVLLDFMMPRMDGEETFIQLRQLGAEVPIVLSSGFGEIETAERFAGKELAGFIQKPYRMEALRKTLRTLLQR